MKSDFLRFVGLAAFAAGAWFTSSFNAGAGPVLPAVGPTPPGLENKVTVGYLKVFSRTERSKWGTGPTVDVHTAYWIYDTSGKCIRTVRNHDTSVDEFPQSVELTPGTYVVKAWSSNDGLVTVPVVIKLARTTTVHLDRSLSSDSRAIDSGRAVTAPSGQVVGWKA